MKQFGFEEANLLDWSNEYIDFVIASKLFLIVYEERKEAVPFWDSLKNIQQKCLSDIGDYSILSRTFQNYMPFGPIGGSREQTQSTLSNFFSGLVPAAYQAAQITKNRSWAISLETDSLMIETLNDFKQFCQIYGLYLEKQVGGTISLNRSPKFVHVSRNPHLSFLIRHGNKSTYNPLLSKKAVYCFEHWRDLVHLYYDSGLKCWWAPTLQFMTDLATWSGKVNLEGQPTPTIDGMLGPVFSRIYVNTGTAIEGLRQKELSVQNYHEYLLLAMSRNDIRKRIGQDNEPVIHKQMEQWGYKHGNRWDRTDFSMLFDRLYLKSRIEDIADKYQINESSVQRRTARLADILDLSLTKAPHKEHRHN
jgi:hypothetical protein